MRDPDVKTVTNAGLLSWSKDTWRWLQDAIPFSSIIWTSEETWLAAKFYHK